MSGIAFNESLILEFDKPMTDREVLSAMTDYLCEKGIVKDTYKQAILEREQSFPTGLKTGGINVAIPHADICHVNEAAICVAVLKTPAPFRAMDEPDNDVPVSLVIMLALTTFTGNSKMGKAMRCVSENKTAASLMGINVPMNIAFTVGLSALICATIGVLVIPIFNVELQMSSMIGLKGFASGVIGGFGYLPGAIVGGILLGVVEIFGSMIIPSVYKDCLSFVLLIIFLLIKPSGILGNRR